MEYTYTLERYAGMKTRHTCPGCNQRGQFTRYVQIDTGEYLADHVGRCNREDKCGYHYTPHEYFSDNPEAKAERTSTLGSKVTSKNESSMPSSFDTIPFEVVKKSMALAPASNLHSFITARFGHEICSKITDQYRLGTSASEQRSTIFWQIDVNQNVRSGKIVHYDSDTGKRGRNINWVHSKIAKQTGKQFQLRQCFFGEHRLPANLNRTVALVESEKTAIICSIVMPDYLWLATGGVNGCRWKEKNVASILLGREIVMFPDLNMYERWCEYARDLKRQLPLDIKVSDLLERVATRGEKEHKSGFDLADFLLKRY